MNTMSHSLASSKTLFINGRKITVLLPASYSHDLNRHYPAVFLQDGDFLFREKLESIEALERMQLMEPVILIGIDSESRLDEYTPWEHPALIPPNPAFKGQGEYYLNWIELQLIPKLRSSFRISPHARDLAIGGASLGGLISLYAMYRKHHVFSKFILLSSSLWFDGFLHFMASHPLPDHLRAYMYVGEKEGAQKSNIQRFMVANHFEAHNILSGKLAPAPSSLIFETHAEGVHEDTFFIHYFLRSLVFLFPHQSSAAHVSK